MNDLITGRHRNRWLALAAAWALIGCAAAYAAHGLADQTHEHSHCDLCVHFSGSAASPAQPEIVGKPILVSRVAPSRREIILPTRSPVGNHLPRGPPLTSGTS
jgi:hypothetical protein